MGANELLLRIKELIKEREQYLAESEGQREQFGLLVVINVLYRVLRGFFEDELRGIRNEGKVNSMICDLSARLFEQRKPVYCFEDKDTIVLHPDWVSLFSAKHYCSAQMVLTCSYPVFSFSQS